MIVFFFFLYDSKLNIFGFRLLGVTKQDVTLATLGLWTINPQHGRLID